MSIQNINRGTSANDGTGDAARTAAQKINANFAYLSSVEARFRTVFGDELGSSISEDAAVEINGSTPFTFEFSNLGYIKYVETNNGDINNIYYFKLTNVSGNQTFGNSTSAFTLTSQNLFLTGQKLKSVEDFEELNTTVTENFGDIGTTSIKDYVNGLSPAVSIQATSVGATILKGIVNGDPVSFLFKGDAGDYGQGELQLNDTDLESLNETTNVSIPIDTVLSLTSSNPVENRVVKAALDALQAQIDNGGADGNGIESVDDNGDGKLTFNFTDGTSYTTPNLTGPKGDKGDTGATGPQGLQGDKGDPGEDLTARTNLTVNKTNNTYTLKASDVDKRLFIPSPCSVIVPNGLAANLEFEGKQTGTGDVEFVAESGGTLNVNLAFQNFTEGEHAYWGIVTLGNNEADLLGTLKLRV